jgi:hypothetical protein
MDKLQYVFSVQWPGINLRVSGISSFFSPYFHKFMSRPGRIGNIEKRHGITFQQLDSLVAELPTTDECVLTLDK